MLKDEKMRFDIFLPLTETILASGSVANIVKGQKTLEVRLSAVLDSKS